MNCNMLWDDDKLIMLICGIYRTSFCNESGRDRQLDKQIDTLAVDLGLVIVDFLRLIGRIDIAKTIEKCENVLRVQVYDQVFDEITFRNAFSTIFTFDE